MKLILCGGGSGNQVTESYKLFSKLVGKNTIMYIPLAWSKGTYDQCAEWFAEEISPYGITDIDTITAPEQITKERLSHVNGVFIGGGNTYTLLKKLKDTNAYDNLKAFALRSDTVIMGGSAGALIWGKSIDTCKDDGSGLQSICDPNYVGLKDTSGFDMVNGYSLFVHYKKKPEQIPATMQRINRLIDRNFKLICLPEETSLFVDDGKFYSIGSLPAEIITKSSRTKSSTDHEIILER